MIIYTYIICVSVGIYIVWESVILSLVIWRLYDDETCWFNVELNVIMINVDEKCKIVDFNDETLWFMMMIMQS